MTGSRWEDIGLRRFTRLRVSLCRFPDVRPEPRRPLHRLAAFDLPLGNGERDPQRGPATIAFLQLAHRFPHHLNGIPVATTLDDLPNKGFGFIIELQDHRAVLLCISVADRRSVSRTARVDR